MEYQQLTDDHLIALRRERVQSLETEHARRAIMLEEVIDEPETARVLQSELDDLQRRIDLHSGRIEPEPEPDDDVEPAPPATLAGRRNGSSTNGRTARPRAARK